MTARPTRFALFPLILMLAACGETTAPPDDGFTPRDSVELEVIGMGAVTERFTAEVAARDGYAYTSTWGTRGKVLGNAVMVWDVTSATPVLVDSVVVDSVGTLGDVQISDDGSLLVVATERGTVPNGSIRIYDLTDPGHPRFLSAFGTADTKTGVHTAKLGRVDGTLYAFLAIDPRPAQLVVVSLADPAHPTGVLVREMGDPYIHDVFVRDGILFTALWDEGLTIWDIGGAGRGGTPANPVMLGNVKTVNGSVHNVWWYHAADGQKRYAFVGEEQPGTIGVESAGDIHVVDVSDLTHPVEVAFYSSLGAGTHNFTMDEARGILYAAYYNGGVRALDVRGDLGGCTASLKDALGRCDLARMRREVGTGLADGGAVYVWGVARVGSALYASDMLNGLWKLDISALSP